MIFYRVVLEKHAPSREGRDGKKIHDIHSQFFVHLRMRCISLSFHSHGENPPNSCFFFFISYGTGIEQINRCFISAMFVYFAIFVRAPVLMVAKIIPLRVYTNWLVDPRTPTKYSYLQNIRKKWGNQEVEGVSRRSVGRLITVSMTSRHTLVIFKMARKLFVLWLLKTMEFRVAKRGCFDPRIGRLANNILYYLYVEFQCFSVCDSSRLFLQSQWSSCGEAIAATNYSVAFLQDRHQR